ncbi:NADPH-dependent FMN reductase [Actinokineospora sp. NPDC004072]
MPSILVLSGSPSETSRTAALGEYAAARLRAGGHLVRTVRVRDLPAVPLLSADTAHPAIADVLAAVEAADALVIATPVYKAAYSGLLKSLLDLLPQAALAGKSVLPVATGGTTAHVLILDYALRPVLSALGAHHILPGRFVLDRHITGPSISPDSRSAVDEAIDAFSASIRPVTAAVL